MDDVDLARDTPLEALATAIAAQTDSLARLRFKFEVQQMMLSGGCTTWVAETTEELEAAIEDVHERDAQFRSVLSDAAASCGLSPESTLREVAAAAEEPWNYIFRQGRDELKRSVERVTALCGENRKLLARGYLATSAALSLLGIETTTAYDASGSPVTSQGSASILNAKA
ncbi:MAG: flagellar export chaperone FlgN [Actinomycetota bacterium]|nr:flagellar export chaperone FlgN [Actinomycetota bacterium]